jgi:hypothetical protein
MAKMGFETDRHIEYDWHNQRPQGFGYRFKSKQEYRWACYLELVCRSNFISRHGGWIGWGYELKTFEFKERHRKRGQYTPDFRISVADGDIPEIITYEWHEVKTSLRQKDIYRFKQFRIDYPEERIILVLNSMPKKNLKQLRLLDNARKYIDDVIIAGPILRKLGL